LTKQNKKRLECKDWFQNYQECLNRVVLEILKQNQKYHQILSLDFYKISQSKLLIAEPGAQEQELHRDGCTRKQYVIAFYITPNKCQSTEFSRYYHGHDHHDISIYYDLSYKILTKKKTELTTVQEKYYKNLADEIVSKGWDEDNLISVPDVPYGSIGIFAIDKIHRGPRNISTIDNREIIFSAFHEVNSPFDDTAQIFEYVSAEWVYGMESDEFAAAVKKNLIKNHRVTSHFSSKTKIFSKIEEIAMQLLGKLNALPVQDLVQHNNLNTIIPKQNNRVATKRSIQPSKTKDIEVNYNKKQRREHSESADSTDSEVIQYNIVISDSDCLQGANKN
jgi:hypothetical protein